MSVTIKQRVLVVDDEADILRVVKDILENEGYIVSLAKNANEAFKKLRETKPDLMILDVKLPGPSGIDICKTVKGDERLAGITVIMLSTKSDDSDKILGLEIGADDYMTKPFSPGELVARVKASLRKNQFKDEDKQILKCDDLVVNLNKHTVNLKNTPIELTKKEFGLLCVLLKKKGKVLDRSFIIESIWGYEYFGTTRTVDVHIKSLRKKLGKYASKISTVEGMGYKFEE
ncbi:MAG: response regulator transcription factor [bacterium]